MKLTILGPGIHGSGPTIHVHKSGCRDCNMPKYRGAERVEYEANTKVDIISMFYQDIAEGNGEPLDLYANEVYFAPCTSLE